jgi:hypothetical protein
MLSCEVPRKASLSEARLAIDSNALFGLHETPLESLMCVGEGLVTDHDAVEVM